VGNSRGARKLARTPHVNKKKKEKKKKKRKIRDRRQAKIGKIKYILFGLRTVRENKVSFV
jgi:hypothetical protein